MSAPHAPTESLSPEVASRLAEFAKACKAATRIVSMYPPTHPAIQAALARISEASKQATYNGPFAITVLPDTLLVAGRGMPKPEQSVNELAVLLHQQGRPPAGTGRRQPPAPPSRSRATDSHSRVDSSSESTSTQKPTTRTPAGSPRGHDGGLTSQ